MGEMRSSTRALPLGVTVHQHTDLNIDTDLQTSWKSLPQSKAALRRIENHVEAVPGTTALLLSVMDPPKKKLSVSVRSRDEARGFSKSKEHHRSSSKKTRSRSPLRNATQDSNVSQHSSMALREQLLSYRETAPSSPPSFELDAYRLQSISGPLSPSSDAQFWKPVYQEDISDTQTDGRQDITGSGDCKEVCYLNDKLTGETLQTNANTSHGTSSVPAIESSSPQPQVSQSVDIQKSSTFLPPASDLICRWESTSSSSPGSDSQRLENLRRHQPDDKLEKLKERIRKQVKHQEEAAEKEKVLSRLEQPIMATKSNNGGTTAKIRKVAAAPQAPTYKGFSKTETRTRNPRGNTLKDESLNRDTSKDRSKQFRESSPHRPQRERYRSVERETKPTRKIHKAASGKNAKTMITPASWREGLKLVNKVLGTAPKKSREKRPHLNDKLPQTASHWHSNVDKGSEANHESRPRSTDGNHCAFQRQSKSHSASISSPSSAGPDKCPVPSSKNLLSADIRAILDDPRLEGKATEEKSRPRSGKGVMVPTYATSKSCRSVKPSPDRAELSNVAEIQEKKRHYDSDKIRQYIVKQKEARKRRQAEEKKSLKEESEKRNQRLQELYRRQKEMAKSVVTPSEVTTTTPWQTRYREETYNLFGMDETLLEEAIQMQSSIASNPLRPMYQPSGESDKENKKLDLPQSPSSSDRSLTDQLSPQLARGDLDVGITSRLNPGLSPAGQSLSASSNGALGCTSYDPLLCRPLRLENTLEAGNLKPTHAETPTWSQTRRSRIDALKATAISLSNRIESEARQIARVGINYGEPTALDTDILAPRSTWADLDKRGLGAGHGTFENADLTSKIQRLITSAGLSPYNSASFSGAGNLHAFKGQPQQITADRTDQSPSSYRLDRIQINGIEGKNDMHQIRPYKPAEDNGDNTTDLHDSSGGSISEGTILSEGSFSKDEISPPHPANSHVLRLTDCSNDCAGQRIEVQHLTDFQKEAAKCLALPLPLAPQNSSKKPWEELNKGDPFSVINIYLKNLNVKVKDGNSPSDSSLPSGDSHRDGEVYDDDFVSFHSSGVGHQSKNSCSPHSVGMESKKSPPSRGRLASPLAFPDLALLQAAASLKNDSQKNGKLHYSPTALQQYVAAELKYQESIDESLRQLSDVERLIGLPVAQEAKQPKSPPSRVRMPSPSGFPDSSSSPDFRSELPKNGFNVGPCNSSSATGNLQYSPAILHQHVTAELQYQESIDESMKHLGDVERLMGVSMAQQESASLVQILKAKQQKYENDLYEQKIQAERKALEAQLQREEDRQRTARAHEELLEKIVLTQKETAEAARHIKELTDLARTRIEGALAVSVVVPESSILSKHQREKQSKSDSENFQREESSQSLSHTDSRPLERPNLIGADASCANSTPCISTNHIKEVNEKELIWKKEDENRAQKEAGSVSIEEEYPTADNDSICSESIPSVADDKEYSFKFDSSRTEDEVEECSSSSLLPSKGHRGSSLENRPHHHTDSEDEAADDSITVVSAPHHVRKNQNPNLAFSSGQDSFTRFTMDMVRQHMKDEDLRLQHQNALLRLRQKAVKEKIRTELAWLEHQKKQLRNKGEDDKLPPIRKKQKGLLLKLQEEQAEIRRLQEANKAARKEKQLLLKQQEDIERMRTSTQRLKERLKSAGCEVPSETPVSETPVSEAAAHNISPADDSRTPSPSPSISASETSSIMQKLKKMRFHMDEKHCSPVHCFFSVFTAQHWASLSLCLPNLDPKFQLFIYNQLDRFLTKREQQLMQRRHHAEELLQWKKRLDQEEAAVRRIEKEALASWREGSIISQSRSKAISPKSSHHRNSESRALRVKEYMTEDDYSSATSECSIHTEPKSPSSAQPASVAEITLASNLSSPTNYVDDFASLTLSKQSSPIKGNHKRVSPSDSTSVSKTQLHSSQISKQEPNQLQESPMSSQTEPISEQSDIESRIKALKEELRKRKYMASQLKREQKMRHKERLKAQEASLLKQLASYDNYIGKTKAELNKDPEPKLQKNSKKDYSLVVDKSSLSSPIKRSETSEIPTVGQYSNSSIHQSHNRSTSASKELNVESVMPSSVNGCPDFLTSGQERSHSPDSLRPHAEHPKSQIIESEKDDTVLESHSAAEDLIAHSDNPPSNDHSCSQDLDILSSVKEAPIRDVQTSPLTDYQDDFESSVPSSPRKEHHISKTDSVCHNEIQHVSQDEEIEEEIAEDLSHFSAVSGTSHESGRLQDFVQQTESPDNDSRNINSTSPAPISSLHSAHLQSKAEMPSFNIGDRVLVGNLQPGTVMFEGPTSFAGGIWVGVALDNPEGSNCGTYDGVVYFHCKERHGIFAPPEKITHLPDKCEFFRYSAGHEESYSDDVSDHCEDQHKSNEELSEKTQIQEKSEETSHQNVLLEFKDISTGLEQTLHSQEQLNAEIHLDSQHHDQGIIENGQERTGIVEKENTVDQYFPPVIEEVAKVEKDDTLDQSTSTSIQEISSVAKNNDKLDQYVPLHSHEISAVVEKEEMAPDNELFSGVSHVAGDHKDTQKDQISPNTLADKLLNTFVIDTVQHLLQIKRAKEQKIEASNQINGAIVWPSEEQRLISLLEPHDGLSSFIPEEEPSSPELCNQLESPILGATGQEELVKRLAELELNRDLLEELGDDQDWFDEDFGLSSRREQQKLQQKQREKEKRAGGELGMSGFSSEAPMRGLVSHSDGDQSLKTPPRPALPLPLPPKLPEQPAMVVPHSAVEVEKMVHAAIQEIWESCGLTKEGRISLSLMSCRKPPQEFLSVDDNTNDLEALSIRSYKQAVYDLTWEILQEIYAEDPNANQPEWVKPQRVRPAFSHRVKTPGDINKVQEFVTEEVLKLYGLTKNKSKKSDWQKMLKFGRKKRDRVDQILVQELHEEEAQWVCYEEDELSVKMQLADSIFDMLLKDTANTLSLITKRTAVS
ncbi:centrosome-associated protein 350 isoform X2 [Syngnathoides biaculeatus]|uniref:centrosome-associated protein 350 isoform X2 n=1 Tax=Syngnathoides biaculeatus TaxID=300417 RepID=UPI002ADD8494|nr:centrosome-associated protein 350 isoform X2 [Syngnathoides biaculeatus]